VLTEITNPPAVTTYRVRLYSGPATNSVFVKYVQFTTDQAKTVQPINLATLGLPAGTYSAGVMALGEHGWGVESARSNYVAVQARRSAARTVRPGRLLSEAQDTSAPPKGARAPAHTDASDEALHNRHRNRHLLGRALFHRPPAAAAQHIRRCLLAGWLAGCLAGWLAGLILHKQWFFESVCFKLHHTLVFNSRAC